MKSIHSALSLLVFITFCAFVASQDVQLKSVGGANFEADAVTATSSTGCATCINYYLDSNGYRNGFFQLTPNELRELNAEGGECCKLELGTSCNAGGCNLHVINRFPNYLVRNFTDSQLSFSGYMGSSENIPTPTSECNPAGDFIICSYTELEYTLYNEEQQVTVGDGSFTVRRDSLGARLRIDNWNFVAGSTGLRLKLSIGTRSVSASGWTLQPGNIPGDTANPQTGFDYVTIADLKQKTAAVAFSAFGSIDGVATNFTVSGIHGSPVNAVHGRTVYVDAPVFTQSMEMHFNLFFPELTGDATGSSSFLFPSVLLFLLAVFFLLIN